MKCRLHTYYNTEITPKMMEKFHHTNKLQVPRLVKIVASMGVGAALEDIKILEKAMEELSLITGQKPVICRAKMAIANFKIKEGNPIGCKVTLRRNMMYEFLDRLISVALPRIRDFSGLPAKSFDKDSNYSFGVNEQGIFPEIDHDKITRAQGMNITIVTNRGTQEEVRELLKLFGIPFKN